MVGLVLMTGGCGGTPILSLSISQPASDEVFTNTDLDLQFVVEGKPESVSLLKDGQVLVSLVPPYQYTFKVGTERDGDIALKLVAQQNGKRVEGPTLVVHLDRKSPRLVAVGPSKLDPWAPIELTFDEPLRVVSEPTSLVTGRTGAIIATTGSTDGATLLIEPMAEWPADEVLSVAGPAPRDRAGNLVDVSSLLPLASARFSIKTWVDRTPPDLSYVSYCAAIVHGKGSLFLSGETHATPRTPTTWSWANGQWTSTVGTAGFQRWVGSDGQLRAAINTSTGYTIQRLAGAKWVEESQISPEPAGLVPANLCPEVGVAGGKDFLLLPWNTAAGTALAQIDLGTVTGGTWQRIPPPSWLKMSYFDLVIGAGEVGLVGINAQRVFIRDASGSWNSSPLQFPQSGFVTFGSAPLENNRSAFFENGEVYVVDASAGITALGTFSGDKYLVKLAASKATVALGLGTGVDAPGQLSVRTLTSTSWKQVTLPVGVVSPFMEFDSTGALWLVDINGADPHVYQLQ